MFAEAGTCVMLEDHGAARLEACTLASHQVEPNLLHNSTLHPPLTSIPLSLHPPPFYSPPPSTPPSLHRLHPPQFLGLVAKDYCTFTVRDCVFRFHDVGLYGGNALSSQPIADEIRRTNTFYVTPRQQLRDAVGVVEGNEHGEADIGVRGNRARLPPCFQLQWRIESVLLSWLQP